MKLSRFAVLIYNDKMCHCPNNYAVFIDRYEFSQYGIIFLSVSWNYMYERINRCSSGHSKLERIAT